MSAPRITAFAAFGHRSRAVAIIVFALLAVVAFNAALAYMAGFLLNLVVPYAIDGGVHSGQTARAGQPLVVNLALVILFGTAHSVCARPSFKAWLTRFVAPEMERSVYVMQSAVLLGFLMWQWRPIEGTVWQVEGWFVWIAYGLFGLGFAIAQWATLALDQHELTGLRQAMSAWSDRPMEEPTFRTPGPYRFVRHPIQTGLLLMFWSTPHMTAGHLVFAGAMTVYIVIGLHFEERALLRQFGKSYARYRKRVPKLVPFMRSMRSTD